MKLQKALTKEQSLVLSQIQTKATNKYGSKLFKTVQKAPDMLFLIDKLLEKEGVPDWKKRYYKALRPEFEGTKEIVDEEVGKLMDAYVDKEIKKAIKKGLLPKPKICTK